MDNSVERLYRLPITTAETKEKMTHFYLTLPSNSSQEYFPDNTLTDFITKLPSTIELTNEWEVGLAEIMFPRSWYTIPKDGLIIIADYRQCDLIWRRDVLKRLRNDELTSDDELDTSIEIKIKGGFYDSMEELTQELKLASAGAFSGLDTSVFYYRSITRRMYVTIPEGMKVDFQPELESILGLCESQNPMCNKTNEKLSIRGNLSCD